MQNAELWLIFGRAENLQLNIFFCTAKRVQNPFMEEKRSFSTITFAKQTYHFGVAKISLANGEYHSSCRMQFVKMNITVLFYKIKQNNSSSFPRGAVARFHSYLSLIWLGFIADAPSRNIYPMLSPNASSL